MIPMIPIDLKEKKTKTVEGNERITDDVNLSNFFRSGRRLTVNILSVILNIIINNNNATKLTKIPKMKIYYRTNHIRLTCYNLSKP